MGQFRGYPRRETHRQQWRRVRRNLTALILLGAGLAALLLCSTLAGHLLLPDGASWWYLLGAFHAALVAGCLHLSHAALAGDEPETIWQTHVASGEESTRDVLRQAKRRRVIWDWVDSVTTEDGHIDHLVLTRTGRLIVLDSTWRSQADRVNVAAVNQSAHRARSRAQAVTRAVTASGAAETDAGRDRSPVARPAIVMWGAAQHTVPDGTEIQGVAFVPGIKLADWLRDQGGQPVPKSVAEDLLAAIEDFRAGAWEDHVADPPRRGGG